MNKVNVPMICKTCQYWTTLPDMVDNLKRYCDKKHIYTASGITCVFWTYKDKENTNEKN
jgi:hypothetical protein